MSVAYIFGFVFFTTAILIDSAMLLQMAAVLLLVTASLYNWNVFKLLMHKPATS
jgi:hypothetical protein